jgi:hypothetical protein
MQLGIKWKARKDKELYYPPLISKIFYAILLSPLQPKQSALVQLKSALSYKSPSFARTMSTVNLVNRILPGIDSKLSSWMFKNNRFPWAPGNPQLIAFGTGAAVFRIDWKSGAKVLRLYRKSLGKSASGLLEIAEYYKKNYETALAWYGGPLDLVLPMEFLVLQGLPLVGPIAASLQTYIQADKRDIFEDFSDTDFVKLLQAHPFLRDQFVFFVEQTIRQWDEGKICYDFVGRENLLLVKQEGSYRLKIVDVGFFKFDLPEFNLPAKVAQIEQKLQRLKHLYQLAKGV